MTNTSIPPGRDRFENAVAPPPAFVEKLAALDRAPIVVRGTSGRASLLLVASLTFVVLGVIAIVRGEDEGVSAGMPAILIFGLGIVVAVAHLVRPSIMTITRDGVTVETLFRTWRVDWVEVTGFFVIKAQAGPTSFGTTTADMAAFNRVVPPRVTFLTNRVRDADGAFGPGWPLSALQLTALLNAARARSMKVRDIGPST